MTDKLRVFEAFSGIGSQRKALKNIGIDHEVVAISEIEPFAMQSYNLVHGRTKNLGDIATIDVKDVPDHDFFTYSFPCQDVSNAGKSLGFAKGSGTRSSLLWECQKIIAGKKPKYLMMENVGNLVGKKYIDAFNMWLDWLTEQGYTNYWDKLNALDFNVPQNRERVFVISILDDDQGFEFPEKIPLTAKLDDYLDRTVPDVYYLSDEKIANFLRHTNGKPDLTQQVLGTTHEHGDIKRSIRERVYNPLMVSPTLSATMHKDPPKVLAFDDAFPIGDTGMSLRKFTPRECWRLMGFTDEDYTKAREVTSLRQLYIQAGNSISVDVLEAIFKQLFIKE